MGGVICNGVIVELSTEGYAGKYTLVLIKLTSFKLYLYSFSLKNCSQKKKNIVQKSKFCNDQHPKYFIRYNFVIFLFVLIDLFYFIRV